MASAAENLRIVVLDDDPTGSQTVRGCRLLLRWDRRTLAAGLRHPSPLLFLLANTRALAPEAAAERVRRICRALRPALAEAVGQGVFRQWLIVSRGDSTLRGHFPLEAEVIAAELGPFDATLLVPAFLEGGRTTREGVHRVEGRPAHETPFARDHLYGYASSFLPEWVEEKSGGRIPASAVLRIDHRELTAAAKAGPAGEGGRRRLRQRLAALEGNPVVAVDGERPEQLAALGAAIRQLSAAEAPEGGGRGRRFLCQSAASLLNGLADLPATAPQPERLARLRRQRGGRVLPGLVLVGSHVPLADAQLERLLADPGCGGVELPVARLERILEGPLPGPLLSSLEQAWRERLSAEIDAGRTPVFFTSRGERLCRSASERRALGLAVAAAMARVVGSLAPRLGYLISKGGITTHTLLAEGLDLAAVHLRGQLLPGLSVVEPLDGDGPLAGLPVLTFPGNLGDADTLHRAFRWMEAGVEPGE